MLKQETVIRYERKIGATVYQIESECLPGVREDMIDALIALIRRDIEKLAAGESLR